MAERVALVGIGSNLGDSPAIIKESLGRLEAFSKVCCSSLWRTLPVGCDIDAGDFLNAVARLELDDDHFTEKMTPQVLLQSLQAIEADFGQRSSNRNSPRYLDLDLLVVDDLCCNDDLLTLPHPRALRRHFVLYPASEVAPNYIWPGTEKKLSDLAAALPQVNWGERLS